MRIADPLCSKSATQLVAAGYANPGSGLCLCLQIQPVDHESLPAKWITTDPLLKLRAAVRRELASHDVA